MIIFKDVWKTYSKELFRDNKNALSGLSFQLKTGFTLGLVGANGAGKSTTIRLMLDFIKPDKGTIRIFGQPPSSYLIRRRIGYLPEVANLPENLTVLDLVRFAGETNSLSKNEIKERSEYWLNELELWDSRKKPFKNYSKGMQQRANFVIALLNDPEMLILDEPMSGLDPIGREKIFYLIEGLKQTGKTILFCSHILEDVDRLVDDILVLHKGKNVFYGNPDEFTTKGGKTSLNEAFMSVIKNIK